MGFLWGDVGEILLQHFRLCWWLQTPPFHKLLSLQGAQDIMSTAAGIGSLFFDEMQGKAIWLQGTFLQWQVCIAWKCHRNNISLQSISGFSASHFSLEAVIRFQARPRLPVWLLTTIEAGHVIIEVNDWDFQEKPATKFVQNYCISFWPLVVLFQSQEPTQHSLQGWEFSLCTELCCLSQCAVPSNRPSSM